MDLFSTELMAFFPWFHFFSMDNWFLAMDFIFYAVENGLNKFSEPKMNGKIVFPPAPKKGMVKFPGKGHFKRAKTG